MNGKQAKILRRIARGLEVVNGGELVEVHGTKRVRTSANGGKIQTVTMAHRKGSFRNVLKQIKRDKIAPFNPSENNHALVA
ncbi:hypothetical protein FDJ19_gp094 [Vibrio phage Ceto]|uniref:Uncharacterized protein n=1 Tax=Vibrio phage Ceto TaxID=2570300 RepID=A0A2H5BGI4_9CAUD|nr:hypothetical protein FDJ19_gp094 [Vibrio phage Ceto]AUG85101.1 hypothetical protein CETO_94 [Vibrio phage Ceto]